MPVPTLTYFRFLVLGIVQAFGDQPTPAVKVRSELKTLHGVKQHDANFYIMMKRMEEANLLTGAYQERQKVYQITELGRSALLRVEEFYKVPAATGKEQ